MSSNGIQFGLPFVAPVTQSILPIVTANGAVMGFYPITSTAFTGTETTYELTEGPVPLTTVTRQQGVQDGVGASGTNYGIPQFMAAQWPSNTDGIAPWIGYSEWVGPNSTGYYRWWSLPTEAIILHFGRGVLMDSLLININKYPSVPGTVEPPVGSNGALRWACSVDPVSISQECAFFDFQWMDLFQASLTADQQGLVFPQFITTVSNPVGGVFKASVVQGYGGGQPVAGGAIVFSTIRILKLGDAVPGTYDFQFLITSLTNGLVETTPVTLVLTVV